MSLSLPAAAAAAAAAGVGDDEEQLQPSPGRKHHKDTTPASSAAASGPPRPHTLPGQRIVRIPSAAEAAAAASSTPAVGEATAPPSSPPAAATLSPEEAAAVAAAEAAAMKRLVKFLDSLGAAVPAGWRVTIYRRLERGKMTNRSKFIAPDGVCSYGSVNAVARALGLEVPGEWVVTGWVDTRVHMSYIASQQQQCRMCCCMYGSSHTGFYGAVDASCAL
jgi:hypothetical protein